MPQTFREKQYVFILEKKQVICSCFILYFKCAFSILILICMRFSGKYFKNVKIYTEHINCDDKEEIVFVPDENETYSVVS